MARPDQERVKDLEAARAPLFLAYTLGHLGVWAFGLFGVSRCTGPVPLFLLSLLLGSQLHALTILQHECGHGTAFRSAGANLWVGRVLAVFIVLPFTAFTEAHKRHHWFLGDEKKDPDEWYYAGGTPQVFFREMLFVPYFILLSLRDFGPRTRRTVALELLVHGVVWSLLVLTLSQAGLTRLLLFGFCAPMAWLAFFLNPLSRGFEHYPMARMSRNDPRRKDLHANTVTVTHPFFGFLWANITFHVEHHLFPKVPFFALPRVHALLRRHNRFLTAPFPLAGWDGALPLNGTPLQETP